MKRTRGGAGRSPEKPLLESLFSESDALIAFVRPDLTIIRVNRAFASRGGHAPSWYTGRELRLFFPDPRVEATIRAVARTRVAFSASADRIGFGDLLETEPTLWDWSVRAVVDDRRAVTGLVLSCLDVTTRAASAGEAERSRIARELHDGVGQTLTAIKLGVETAIRRLGGTAPPEAASGLDEAVSMLRGAIEEVRSLGADFGAVPPGDLGLVAAVHRLCRSHSLRHAGVRIEKDIRVGEVEVPPHLKVIIYRFLECFLEDAARNSRGGRLRLALSRRGHALEVVAENPRPGATPLDGPGRRTLARLGKLVEYSGGSLGASSPEGGGSVLRATWRSPELSV